MYVYIHAEIADCVQSIYSYVSTRIIRIKYDYIQKHLFSADFLMQMSLVINKRTVKLSRFYGMLCIEMSEGYQ